MVGVLIKTIRLDIIMVTNVYNLRNIITNINNYYLYIFIILLHIYKIYFVNSGVTESLETVIFFLRIFFFLFFTAL